MALLLLPISRSVGEQYRKMTAFQVKHKVVAGANPSAREYTLDTTLHTTQYTVHTVHSPQLSGKGCQPAA
jgi:hypothetical protein